MENLQQQAREKGDRHFCELSLEVRRSYKPKDSESMETGTKQKCFKGKGQQVVQMFRTGSGRGDDPEFNQNFQVSFLADEEEKGFSLECLRRKLGCLRVGVFRERGSKGEDLLDSWKTLSRNMVSGGFTGRSFKRKTMLKGLKERYVGVCHQDLFQVLKFSKSSLSFLIERPLFFIGECAIANLVWEI